MSYFTEQHPRYLEELKAIDAQLTGLPLDQGTDLRTPCRRTGRAGGRGARRPQPAPIEFLKAHAILSRSWLLAALQRKKKTKQTSMQSGKITEEEVIRWYDQEDHDLFDVCADDHCQRYQGITETVFNQAEEAVRETHGRVITFQDEICDARYSKACGGLTEEFPTAWDDKRVPYLTSISDASIPHPPIKTEKEASSWILSEPEAYCNTKDKHLLEKILPDFDRETKEFFRWRVEYSREELEEILRQKSGFDFGTLKEITPLRRGPSGRIFQLKIVGSKRSMVVGKDVPGQRFRRPPGLAAGPGRTCPRLHRHARHAAAALAELRDGTRILRVAEVDLSGPAPAHPTAAVMRFPTQRSIFTLTVRQVDTVAAFPADTWKRP